MAAAHGLDAAALPFVVGSTLAEMETSAQTLADFVAEARAEQEAAEPDDPLRRALSAEARSERKRELHAVLTGEPRPQPRDEAGRFTSPAARGGSAPTAGFDGGARPRVPAPADPAAEHQQALGQALGPMRRGGGGWFGA